MIWEIYSLGKVPYPGMSNQETTDKVLSGYRMSVPEGCPKEMTILMKKCWNVKPENRPSFKDIIQEFKDYFGILEFEIPTDVHVAPFNVQDHQLQNNTHQVYVN